MLKKIGQQKLCNGEIVEYFLPQRRCVPKEGAPQKEKRQDLCPPRVKKAAA